MKFFFLDFFSLSGLQLYTQNKREKKLVLLKQRSTHIAINRIGEVVIQRFDAQIEVGELLTVNYGVIVQVDEPVERVLVHGINVGQVTDAEEQNGRVLGHGQVAHACELDFFLRFFGDLLLGGDLFGQRLGRGQNLNGRLVFKDITLLLYLTRL